MLVYVMAAEERKEGEMGFYFIGPQSASICPYSTVFLFMAKPEKRLFCHPNPDPEKTLASLRILHYC